MSEIMLIRNFDKPIGADYLHQATIALNWCRKLYGVSPSIHFLARDGLRCACIFDAPDAEAVRNVIRSGGRSEPEAVWPCTIHPGPDDDGASVPVQPGSTGALVLVERLVEPRSGADSVLPLDRDDVRHVRSYLSHDRRRVILIYTAPDLELVRAAYRTAGLELDRIWAAHAIDGMATTTELQSL